MGFRLDRVTRICDFFVDSFWWDWAPLEQTRSPAPPSHASWRPTGRTWTSRTRKDRRHWTCVPTPTCVKPWPNVTRRGIGRSEVRVHEAQCQKKITWQSEVALKNCMFTLLKVRSKKKKLKCASLFRIFFSFSFRIKYR